MSEVRTIRLREYTRLVYWCVKYYRDGEQKGYCIVSAKSPMTALRRAKREFLNHKPGDTFVVMEG